MTGLGGGAGSLFRHSGGGGDWGGLSTGDTYQNGKVYKPNATTFQIWYYPQSRKGQSLTYSMSNLSGTFEVRQQTNMKIYMVGGGGGGAGENGSGGSGGGGIIVGGSGYFTPPDLTTYTFTVGKGGRGGVTGTTQSAPGLGNDTNNQPESGQDTTLTGGGLNLSAGGGPNHGSNVNANPGPAASTNTINQNTPSYTIITGSGGRGGSRNYGGSNLDGTQGNAGGGGGNNYFPSGAADYDDDGGAAAGYFAGGGGAGNGYRTPWSVNQTTRQGGSGGGYGFNGGYGGNAQTNNFGQSGICPTDNTTDYPNFHAGGGRAFDNTTIGTLVIQRGSAGGGGFPGGGGGSSYYGDGSSNMGLGADGASGIVCFQWTL